MMMIRILFLLQVNYWKGGIEDCNRKVHDTSKIITAYDNEEIIVLPQRNQQAAKEILISGSLADDINASGLVLLDKHKPKGGKIRMTVSPSEGYIYLLT